MHAVYDIVYQWFPDLCGQSCFFILDNLLCLYVIVAAC